MRKGKEALSLFLSFFKIGAFTFGGGYAMLPLIERETSERRHWIEPDEMSELVAIAQSTPGPIALNAATFIGNRVAGVPGALAATLGTVAPSFLIIFLLSFALEFFAAVPAVRYAFFGLRAGVLGLVFKALVSMFQKRPKLKFAYFVMAAAFIAVAVFKLGAVWVVIGAALAGIVRAAVLARKEAAK